MTHLRPTHPLMVTLLCCGLACASPTTDDDTGEQEWNGGYLLASVVITDVGRTTYFSVVPELDGHLTNDSAIEVPGNAVYLVSGNSVLIGLAEAPTWVKWEISETGELTQVGQLSLANYGLAAIDFGNTLVDETTAVSVSSDTLVAIIWDPTSMTITGTVDLSHLEQDSYDLENWTTTTGPDGPRLHPRALGRLERRSDLPAGIDDHHRSQGPERGRDRRGCSLRERRSAGVRTRRPRVRARRRAQLLGADVRERGRRAGGRQLHPADPAGTTDFDPDYYFAIPSLTGGLEAITELETAEQGSGVGFVKIFHPDQLPEGVEPIDFAFWDYNAHQLWRLELGDEPSIGPVEGAPFSAIGFPGVATRGLLYLGESEDAGANSTVYEVDPSTNTMTPAFTMDGYFYGAHALP